MRCAVLPRLPGGSRASRAFARRSCLTSAPRPEDGQGAPHAGQTFPHPGIARCPDRHTRAARPGFEHHAAATLTGEGDFTADKVPLRQLAVVTAHHGNLRISKNDGQRRKSSEITYQSWSGSCLRWTRPQGRMKWICRVSGCIHSKERAGAFSQSGYLVIGA